MILTAFVDNSVKCRLCGDHIILSVINVNDVQLWRPTTVNIFVSSTVEMYWRHGQTCIWSEKSISVTIVWSVPSSRLDLAMSENDYSPVLKGLVKQPNGCFKRPSLPPFTEYFKKFQGGRFPTFPSLFFLYKNGYFLAQNTKYILFVCISLALSIKFSVLFWSFLNLFGAKTPLLSLVDEKLLHLKWTGSCFRKTKSAEKRRENLPIIILKSFLSDADILFDILYLLSYKCAILN